MALAKADSVESVQTEIGFTKHRSRKLVENLVELIRSNLESGEDVLVTGFGKFCANEKRELSWTRIRKCSIGGLMRYGQNEVYKTVNGV